jgi:hypothetical protein
VCADILAKMSPLSDSLLVIISSPPNELATPLLADAQGVVFIREYFCLLFFSFVFSLLTKKTISGLVQSMKHKKLQITFEFILCF